MALQLERQEHYRAVFTASDDTLFIAGRINDLYPSEYLDHILETVIAQAETTGRITIDVSALEFINSSGIASLVKKLSRKPRSLSVVIQIGKPWQKVSFSIFRTIVDSSITVRSTVEM